MLKYKIIETTTADELSAMVNLAIVDGWLPQGGVAFCMSNPGYWHYRQAMIKN